MKLEALAQFKPQPRHVLLVPHLANQREWMSVNHFPYLPILTNPENNPCIQTVIRIATKFQPVVHWPIANLPWKFHANPFWGFCAKLLTNRQTGRQTNNDENISFFAEIISVPSACTVQRYSLRKSRYGMTVGNVSVLDRQRPTSSAYQTNRVFFLAIRSHDKNRKEVQTYAWKVLFRRARNQFCWSTPVQWFVASLRYLHAWRTCNAVTDSQRHGTTIYTVCGKRCRYIFASNFAEFWPIFKILSATELYQ